MSMSIKARRKRLLVLADWLENDVQPALNGAKFRIAHWQNFPASNVKEAKECGFVGCAVGWGALCPRLPGLRAIRDDCGFDFFSVETYFGMSTSEAIRAFTASAYADSVYTKIPTVATRLREIAAE